MQGTIPLKNLFHRSLQKKTSNYFFGEIQYGSLKSTSNSTEYCTQNDSCMRLYAGSSHSQCPKVSNQLALYSFLGQIETSEKSVLNTCLPKIKTAENNIFEKKCVFKKFHAEPQSNFEYKSYQNKEDSRHEIDLCSSTQVTNSKKLSTNSTREELAEIKLKLTNTLPDFFETSSKHPFEIYSKNLIFDNRINGTKSSGLKKYISQAILLKNYTKLKFSSAKFVILDITSNEDDNTIKMRWRIVGVPHKVFQYLSLSKTSSKEELHDSWYDGFSIFHLGGDGLIDLHEVDMVMPDEERQFVQKLSIGSQIAIALGLGPKTVITACVKTEDENNFFGNHL